MGQAQRSLEGLAHRPAQGRQGRHEPGPGRHQETRRGPGAEAQAAQRQEKEVTTAVLHVEQTPEAA